MTRKASNSPTSFLSAFLTLMFCSSFVSSSLLADEEVVVTVETENHQQAIEAWRASRHERLKQPDGWLTLVGLEWLGDGETRIGSASDNDIQLSGGPAYWGQCGSTGQPITL